MNISKIAIIGAGQLGSRHLQALALVNRPMVIEVVDPSCQALEVAKERFNQIRDSSKNSITIDYYHEIGDLSEQLDIVIIATNSNVRRSIIEQLLNSKKIRYLILEKVVFQHPDDFSFINTMLDNYKVKAWVNCPRRMWPFYQQLRQDLQGAQFVDYHIKGSQWGLSCNAIHMLDHYAFLTGKNQIRLWGDHLDDDIIPSKRTGFIEFTGTLYGEAIDGGLISMTSYSVGDTPAVIDISSDIIRCMIRETEGKAWIARKVQNWQWNEVEFEVMYQSRLTNLAVQQILDTNECSLPTYQEAWNLHVPLLEVFINHIQKQTTEDIKLCPIT